MKTILMLFCIASLTIASAFAQGCLGCDGVDASCYQCHGPSWIRGNVYLAGVCMGGCDFVGGSFSAMQKARMVSQTAFVDPYRGISQGRAPEGSGASAIHATGSVGQGPAVSDAIHSDPHSATGV